MQKIILILILVLISQNLFSEEKKSIATIVATVRGFGLPQVDGHGNLVVGNLEGIFLMGSDGKIIRQITPKQPNPLFRNFLATKGNAVCLNSAPTLQFYSTEKELTKLGNLPENAFGPNYLALKNGNVLVAHKEGPLKIVTPKGTIAFQTNLEGEIGAARSPSEYPDGTIFISTHRRKYFLSPELKLLKDLDGVCSNRGMAHSAGLNICSGNNYLLTLFTSKGDLKFSFNSGNKELVSFLSLPNGLTAFMLADGHIHFIDSDGNKKFSHFHDTEFYSSLVLVSDKIMAYWNKTEIVYLDLQGNEIGTFTMPFAREPSKINIELGNGKLISLGNGIVVAPTHEGLHFIKLN